MIAGRGDMIENSHTKEKDLVLAARGGDRDAFNELISNYTDRIYRLAWKLSGNQEDAEDIFQETFLKAVDNIGSFRLESSFGTWLYSIAMNVMRACFAKRKKMQLGTIEDYLPDHENGTNSFCLLPQVSPLRCSISENRTIIVVLLSGRMI
jgi:RNA polymerase sigma-70 factor (ECF subfamily)